MILIKRQCRALRHAPRLFHQRREQRPGRAGKLSAIADIKLNDDIRCDVTKSIYVTSDGRRLDTVKHD